MIKHFIKGLIVLGCVALSFPARAAEGDNRTTTPTETNFYRIKSAYSSFSQTKMVYANGLNMSWKNLDEADPTSIWVFAPGSADGKYKLRSAYNGLYQQTRSGNSQDFLLGDTETEVTIHLKEGTTDQVYITNTYAMHCGGHGGGTGVSGTIVSWEQTPSSDAASFWYLECVDDDDAVLNTLKEYYLSSIAHLSPANQAKFADEVAVINNSGSSANQIVDAYLSIKNKLAEVISFVQIESESMLQTGGKYVVGVVGKHQTVWQPINPLCYKATDANTFGFEGKPDLDFSPEFIWTANVSSDYVCNNTTALHNGPHKVLQLSQNFNGTEKAIRLNASHTNVLAATTDRATFMEFVPIEATDFADELLFQLHINVHSSNSQNFQQIHSVAPSGNLGWYSRGSGAWDTNLLGSTAGLDDSYSGLHRVYMVIDSEDFPGAAEVLWNAFKEEECATSESDHYKQQVNAIQLPDISAYTNASTFINDLRKEFQKELFKLDADYTATITPLTVNYNTGNATGWNHTLTDWKGAFARIIAHNGTSEGLAGNITKLDNNTFDFRNGSVHTSRYVVECFNPAFSIIGVSFQASTTEASEYVTVDGEDIHLTSTPQTIIATTPDFVFHGNNKSVRVTDFTIKYRRTTTESAYPAESGWYSILSTHNLQPYAGKWAVNLERDVRQNDTNYYSLGVSDNFSNAPASNLIYIEVSGNNRYLKSSNGHFVNENGTSSRTRGGNTRFRSLDETNRAMQIGGYWDKFQPTADGVAYDLIGQSSGATAHRWAVFKENPEELYDIWTVSIAGAPNASAIQNDVRVQCTNAHNKGLGKVFNNGNFFIEKGATVTVNDFVADPLEDTSKCPVITINATTKTINVHYYTKQEFIDLYGTAVENTYAGYRNSALFDQELVDALIAEHKAEVAVAVGEDDVISAEDVAAADASVAPATFTDRYKQIRNTAVGKLVQFRNYDHKAYYFAVAPVSEESTSYRGVGLTDNTSINTLWQIESANADLGTIYLKNYGTGLWMQTVGARDTDVPAAASDPVSYEIEAYLISGTPVLGFKDTVNGSLKYLHQVTNNGNRLVKWNDPVGSPASGWTVTLADDDEFSEGFDVTYEQTDDRGLVMVFSHAQGVSMHDNYFDGHHSILIRKSSQNAHRVQARDGGDEATDEFLVTPDKFTYNSGRGTVSFPINEDGQLEDGQRYDVTIPAALVKIGDSKISKADNRTFTYSELETTGIKDVENAPEANVVYDLMGRRLAAPVKGLNIVNGKKTFIR